MRPRPCRLPCPTRWPRSRGTGAPGICGRPAWPAGTRPTCPTRTTTTESSDDLARRGARRSRAPSAVEERLASVTLAEAVRADRRDGAIEVIGEQPDGRAERALLVRFE